MKKMSLILAIAFIFGASAVSFANEWSLYGSARMATFWTSRDLGDAYKSSTNPSGDDAFGRSNVQNLQWNLQGNSRIGGKVTGDTLEARFEFGVGESDVTARLIYGIWKFSENWALKIGKDYTPILFGLSNQVFNNDLNLWQFGNAYGGRVGQIALEGRGFKFAAISPTEAQTFEAEGNVSAIATENYWPKLEASYKYVFGDNMSVHVFGGWQNYKYYASLNDGTSKSDTINSVVIGAGGDFNFGPVYIKPQASWYKNGAAADWLEATLKGGGASISTAPVVGPDGNVRDVDSFMAMLAIGYAATERVRFEIGGGWLRNEGQGDLDLDNDLYALYLQSVLTLAPSVYLVPEIGYIDFGDAKTTTTDVIRVDEQLGDLWYIGAKWQIDF
ncbi:MAG: hypothetical protein ACK2U6_02580 [Candidatus Promineifilaceae bacterium]|jgi:hypothetical protein